MKLLRNSILIVVTAMLSHVCAEKAPQKVFELIESTLKQYSSDVIIVNAVKTENAKKKTLADIKKEDTMWRSTPGYSDFMNSLMKSECGKHLQDMQKKYKYIAEIFVMDNLGANVAMSDKTSDYWQGDEAKFKESFKGGKGAVHVSDVEFDDSTQTYSVQVSIPVKDGNTVIGAITFGIDLDAL